MDNSKLIIAAVVTGALIAGASFALAKKLCKNEKVREAAKEVSKEFSETLKETQELITKAAEETLEQSIPGPIKANQ